jgi:hypothetical protein
MSYRQVAAVAGFESATLRLTAGCSSSASLMILPSIIPTANPRPNIVLPLRRQMTTLPFPPARQGTACHDDTAGAPSGQARTGSPPINPGRTSPDHGHWTPDHPRRTIDNGRLTRSASNLQRTKGAPCYAPCPMPHAACWCDIGKWCMMLDGFVKSPSAALRFIFRHCGVRLCTPHASRFGRLASGAFYCAVYLGDFLRSHHACIPGPDKFAKAV